MIVLAALLVAAAPTGNVPPAAGATSSAVTASAANAMILSRLLNPEEKVVGIAVRGLEVGFEAALSGRPEDAKVFDEHPGLAEALVGAARPVIAAHVRKSVPTMQSRYARFYAQRFDSPELDKLIAFYSSPTGVKMVEGIYAGFDFTPFIDKLGSDPDARLESGDVKAITGSTVQRINPVFDDADKAAMIAFSATPLYAKLRRVLPDFQKLVADLANEPDPALDAALEAIIEKTVQEFLAREEHAASTG